MSYFNIQDAIYSTTTGNVGIGITNPSKTLEVVGDIDTTTDYNVNGTQVLSATTLGSAVVNSSLTSLGTQAENLDMGDYQISGAKKLFLDSDSVTNKLNLTRSDNSVSGFMIAQGNNQAVTINQTEDADIIFKTNSTARLTLDASGDIDCNSNDITSVGTITATTLSGGVSASSLTVNGASSFTGTTVFERANSTAEGGQIDLKMSDNANKWYIDCYGSTTDEQDLRFFSSASGNKVQIQSDLEVTGTMYQGATVLKGDIVPDTDNAYDIGSATYKIRDMYVSDNSLWVGDSHKVSISDGRLKFRKRITESVPAAITAANGSASAALDHAGVINLSQMKLKHWKAYMRTLSGQSGATIQDIFRDDAADYVEESASDNWLESGTKTYNQVGNVGIGTQDPAALLHLYYEPQASYGLKELLRLSWDDGNYNTLKGDGTKISFHTSNTNNFPGTVEAGYFGVMKANAVEANTECDFSLGLNDGSSVLERIRILSDGNVGIGDFSSSSPGYKLDVIGDINLTGDLRINGAAQSFSDTNTQLTQEQVEDYINGLIVAGSNITKTYDDSAGTLTIASTASGGGSSVWSEASSIASYDNAVRIGDTTGFVTGESNFQAGNTLLAGKGYLDVPWICTGGIENYTEKGSGGTAMLFGTTKSSSGTDKISFLTNGISRVQINGDGLIIKELGDIEFHRTDDSLAASISSNNEGLTISEVRGANITSYQMGGDHHIFSSNNTERMRITSSGDVGIGITDPSTMLSLGNGTNKTKFGLWDSGSSSIGMGIQSAEFGFYLDNSANKYTFYDTEAWTNDLLTILGTGNVGIDIASPSEKLHIHDSTSNTGVYMRFTTADTGTASTDGAYIGLDNSEQFYVFNKEDKMMLFGTNNTTRMMIQPSSVGGNILINNSLSLGHNSTPSSVLDISTGSTVGGNTKNCAIKFNNHDAGARFVVWDNGASVNDYAGLGKTSSALDICIPSSSNHFAFKVDGSEKMRIQGNGNVGIGLTYVDGVKLQVYGKSRFDTTQTNAPSNNTYGGSGCRIILWPGSSSQPPYGFGINGSTIWTSCPESAVHKWYIGTTWRAQLSSSQFYVNGSIRGSILYVNGSQGIKTPTGSYGTVQCSGNGTGGWEGYSIDGSWVFMANNSDQCGIYNDLDNKWISLYGRYGNSSYYKIFVQGEEKFQVNNGGRLLLNNSGAHNDYCFSVTTDNGKGQMAWRWNASGGGTTDFNLDIYMDNNSGNNQKVGYLENSGSGSWRLNDFTGQHRCIPQNNTNSSMFGLIVYSTGKYMNIDNNLKPTIIDSLPICELCTIENDPRVFGVISDEADDNKDRKVGYGIFGTYQDKTNKNEKRIHINGVGEGAMWVCNKNGNVSNGSYITSSAVGGYGMKQESNQLLNSSVAKITCDCNFNLNPIVKQKVKVIENIKTLKRAKKITEEITIVETRYDEETNQYRQFEKIKTSSKIETEQFPVYDSNGEQLLNEKGEPRIYKKEVMEEYQVIEKDLDFDENGDIQYEDDLDDNGHQQMEYEYDTRFLNSDGSIISSEEEYQNKKDSGENVYISCFVGCTYHCG